MKRYLFISGLLCLLFAACSLDNRLKPADGVFLTAAESTDAPAALAGDTLWFKFVASSNNSPLARMEIVEQDFESDNVIDKARFAMTDTSMVLTVDSDGYFSRPVFSVLVQFPVPMPKNAELVGTRLSMSIRVSNEAGESAIVSSGFKIVNSVRKEPYASIGLNWGFVCAMGTTGQGVNLKNVPQRYKDADVYLEYDKEGTSYLCGPSASQELRELLESRPNIEFDPELLKSAKLIELEMTTADYTKFTEEELDALDFSEGADKIALKLNTTQFIAYETSGGRRCLMQCKLGANSFAIQKTFYYYWVKEDEENAKENAENK